ncbi:YicS family protein [Buttiauxella sp.]|uniref:YicS family protein n=1 Tax=Buttiauxella sp. TaxID=1972222 RepID=UPI003C712247
MTFARNLSLLLLVLCSTNALASSPYESLQFGKYKQQITADLKKTCHPQKKMSDEAWGNKILANEDNKLLIRDARIALERNNEKNYWDAISKVECPEM